MLTVNDTDIDIQLYKSESEFSRDVCVYCPLQLALKTESIAPKRMCKLSIVTLVLFQIKSSAISCPNSHNFPLLTIP